MEISALASSPNLAISLANKASPLLQHPGVSQQSPHSPHKPGFNLIPALLRGNKHRAQLSVFSALGILPTSCSPYPQLPILRWTHGSGLESLVLPCQSLLQVWPHGNSRSRAACASWSSCKHDAQAGSRCNLLFTVFRARPMNTSLGFRCCIMHLSCTVFSRCLLHLVFL